MLLTRLAGLILRREVKSCDTRLFLNDGTGHFTNSSSGTGVVWFVLEGLLFGQHAEKDGRDIVVAACLRAATFNSCNALSIFGLY